MKKTLYILIVLIGFLNACQKVEDDEVINNTQDREYCGYVSGELRIYVNIGMSTSEIFSLVNSYNLSIYELSEVRYGSFLHTDSVNYIDSVIRSKEYVSPDTHLPYVQPQAPDSFKYQLFPILSELDTVYQKDWLHTMDTLQMFDLAAKYRLIKVSALYLHGAEDVWIDSLNMDPLIDSATLVKVYCK